MQLDENKKQNEKIIKALENAQGENSKIDGSKLIEIKEFSKKEIKQLEVQIENLKLKHTRELSEMN